MHVDKGDVSAAFLHGGDTELQRGVWAEPVQELAETLKLRPWPCVRLKKAAASVEPCLWRLVTEDGRMLGLCGVQVDRFLVALVGGKEWNSTALLRGRSGSLQCLATQTSLGFKRNSRFDEEKNTPLEPREHSTSCSVKPNNHALVH